MTKAIELRHIDFSTEAYDATHTNKSQAEMEFAHWTVKALIDLLYNLPKESPFRIDVENRAGFPYIVVTEEINCVESVNTSKLSRALRMIPFIRKKPRSK